MKGGTTRSIMTKQESRNLAAVAGLMSQVRDVLPDILSDVCAAHSMDYKELGQAIAQVTETILDEDGFSDSTIIQLSGLGVYVSAFVNEENWYENSQPCYCCRGDLRPG